MRTVVLPTPTESQLWEKREMECRKEAAEMRADAAGSKDERVRNALIAAAEQLESHGLYCAQRSLEQA